MNALMLGLWCAAAAGAPPAPPLPQEPVAIAVMMFSAPDAALASAVAFAVAGHSVSRCASTKPVSMPFDASSGRAAKARSSGRLVANGPASPLLTSRAQGWSSTSL